MVHQLLLQDGTLPQIHNWMKLQTRGATWSRTRCLGRHGCEVTRGSPCKHLHPAGNREHPCSLVEGITHDQTQGLALFTLQSQQSSLRIKPNGARTREWLWCSANKKMLLQLNQLPSCSTPMLQSGIQYTDARFLMLSISTDSATKFESHLLMRSLRLCWPSAGAGT